MITITDANFIAALAAFLLLYYIVPQRFQWILLLVASFAFYLQGGLMPLLYLLFTIVTTYAAGLALGALDKKKERTRRKSIVFLVLLLNFGLLFVIKYVPRSGLILPMGLSFYMFQAAGYVVDCYRKKYEPQRNFFKFALFISFFPQLIQGPVSRYDDLGKQLFSPHAFSADNLKYGLQLMMWGYIKKLVIANRISVFVTEVFDNYEGHGGALYLAAAACSIIQLYCDFSGGIDIVSGVSECMGIKLPLNFKRPLFSTSLADYWQRWHITLYTWLRDYLFYPVAFSAPFIRLGEWSRKRFKGKAGKAVPTTIASFVVYFAIGIWHGASPGYLAFAIFNAALITLSNVFPVLLKTPKWISMPRTWLLLIISEFMIRPKNLRLGMRMLSNVFTNFQAHELSLSTLNALGISSFDFIVVLAGLLAVLVLESVQERGIRIRVSLEQQALPVQWLFILLPLACVIFLGFLTGAAIDASFIYGQF